MENVANLVHWDHKELGDPLEEQGHQEVMATLDLEETRVLKVFEVLQEMTVPLGHQEIQANKELLETPVLGETQETREMSVPRAPVGLLAPLGSVEVTEKQVNLVQMVLMADLEELETTELEEKPDHLVQPDPLALAVLQEQLA